MQKHGPNRTQPQSTDWNILKLLRWSASYFESHQIDSPRATAEILLASTLGLERIDLYIRHDRPMSAAELADYKQLIKRRVRREPVAYILGEKQFWGLDLRVNPWVLIPRPDTECLVETTLALLPRKPATTGQRILELGTGSGAVILAVASERPGNRYWATDRSLPILVTAKNNAKRHNLEHRVRFLASDWFDGLKHGMRTDQGAFDLILSNPPYVPTAEIEKLAPEIKCNEPSAALDGGSDGLAWIRHIITQAPLYLKSKARLLLEIGFDQKAAVQRIATGAGAYDDIQFFKDLAGHHRVAALRRKRE